MQVTRFPGGRSASAEITQSGYAARIGAPPVAGGDDPLANGVGSSTYCSVVHQLSAANQAELEAPSIH
jgi:hypothetical protein